MRTLAKDAKPPSVRRPQPPRITGAPDTTVAPVPLPPPGTSLPPQSESPPGPGAVPRQRGEGPVCPKCGSGMVRDRGDERQTHPFVVVKRFRCLADQCGTRITVRERRR